jgi:ABC-type nitrate/sulfonate/bicarbonate transport system substrate-binding protein
MTTTTTVTANPTPGLDQLWYTRCPVPTASGLANRLGWLADDFAADGLAVGVLQDAAPEIARHHFDHQLLGLFREGGNVPALAARSEGAATRLIGLTWIDEWQTILVRPDSGITEPGHLRGKRVALPAWAASRGESFPRAMALHGFKGALGAAGLTLDDIELVEVPVRQRVQVTPAGNRLAGFWSGLTQLAAGELDAVYVKGARAADEAAQLGLVVGVDLDAFTDRRHRVNNGTPRPITVHRQLLDERPDLVVRFLVQTLRAADWAATHLDEVRAILAEETYSEGDGVVTAYGNEFHRSLHPDLSDERLALLDVQKRFLGVHGFLTEDFDLAGWADAEPLAAARSIVAGSAGLAK